MADTVNGRHRVVKQSSSDPSEPVAEVSGNGSGGKQDLRINELRTNVDSHENKTATCHDDDDGDTEADRVEIYEVRVECGVCGEAKTTQTRIVMKHKRSTYGVKYGDVRGEVR